MNILDRHNPASPDQYSEEVLNASWLPHITLMGIGTKQQRRRKPGRDTIKDPESFLRRLYRAQE